VASAGVATLRLPLLQGLQAIGELALSHTKNLPRRRAHPSARSAIGADTTKGAIMISTDNVKRIAVKALMSGGMALAAVGLASGVAQATDGHDHITPSHPPIYAPVHANAHCVIGCPPPTAPQGEVQGNPALPDPDSLNDGQR
jgi:hypothetical protein